MKRFFLFAGRYVLAALACVYLLTVGWLREGGREILHEVLFRLGWRRRPAPEPDGPVCLVPRSPAQAWVADAAPVRVLEPDAADGNVTGYELLVIAQIMAAAKPQACFEIGTFDGRTTLNLAANSAEGGRVYTLDLPPQDLNRTGLKIAHGDENFIKKDRSGARFAGTAYEPQITQLYGDSATFDFSPYEGKMDVVFVDGAHSYDYVKNDTAVALRLLKPGGGIILWHDYGSRYWKDLTRAINELHQERPEFANMRHIKDTAIVVWKK